MFNNLFNRVHSSSKGIRENPSIVNGFEIVDLGILFSLVDAERLALVRPEERDFVAYLLQLEEEDYLISLPNKMLLTWDNIYRLISDQDHEISIKLLGLPDLKSVSPILRSQGSLADSDFSVIIAGWFDEENHETITVSSRIGPCFKYQGETVLLPQASWAVLKEIKEFERLKIEQPGELTNQVAWSQMRRLGGLANAKFDSFLERSIVLKPESLRLKLSKSTDEEINVVQVEPYFEDQPNGWIETFDGMQFVPDRYSISSANGGVTHVLISPEVKAVLQEIRKLPGRRVAGDNALQLLRNPFACLGDDALKVIDEEQFQVDREEADFSFYRFQLLPMFTDEQKILEVHLELNPISSSHLQTVTQTFLDAGTLHLFVEELHKKMSIGLSCGFWKGYQLELADFTHEQLSGLEALVERWKKEAHGDFFEQLFDLSSYGSRVIGIGAATAINSPYIQTESKQQWIPDELLSTEFSEFGSLVNVEMDGVVQLEEIRKSIADAQLGNFDSVTIPGTKDKVPLEVAMAIEKKWSSQVNSQGKSKGSEIQKTTKPIILIENNIELAKFVANRSEKLSLPIGVKPILPKSLKPEVKLRDHQLMGVAQLQHVYGLSPRDASGYLLADDMGLGKTIQLLTFIFCQVEQSPNDGPVLIIAPVSLLDNWENEMSRFFDVDMSKVLKLYGSSLSAIKLSKSQLPAHVKAMGITNLLIPDWFKDRKVVLTTYETLRDQEFSLARQHWSIVVCDEAQKIKNPGALVTQAAKALPARFKIACTGTPVENSLTDLWCLFDFIQPGFLGALNDFGKKFQRVENEEEEIYQKRIETLREIIKPQLLRRMKKDIAKDLPPKYESEECKSLLMGTKQEALYRHELATFSNSGSTEGKKSQGNTAILGLLHKMKMICAHPSLVDASIDAVIDSPKLSWVLTELEKIKSKDEKVILFTEFREIQRALQLAILDKFGLQVTVINGDTSSSSEKADSRQKLIDRFQAKPGFGAIILSTTAVGFGVNVQKANHVIHYTRTWNPAKEDQATDRSYRIGQEKPVYVYYPTVTATSFSTFEQKLDRLLKQKRELADDMLRGTGDVDIQQLASAPTV